MLFFGTAPFLECSTQGDRRFSAFGARVDNHCIEELYQGYKVFSNGSTRLHWKQAKKRSDCVNLDEARALYSWLWDKYIEEHPALLRILCKAGGLSDVFGQLGHACQAEELWRIRNDCK